jgi:hypothetical protein
MPNAFALCNVLRNAPARRPLHRNGQAHRGLLAKLGILRDTAFLPA